MNPCLPEWTIEAELPVPHQKKPMGFDHELVELLWRNGEVVLHSQTHKKQPGYDSNESRQFNRHDQPTIRVAGSCGNQINLTHDDETVAWLNCAIDDSFDKEFCSPFLSDISTTPLEADKSIRQPENNKILKFDPLEINHVLPQSHHSDFDPNPMPPPRFHNFGSTQQHHIGGYQKGVNFPPPVRSSNAQLGGKEARRNLMLQDINEGSVTVGTSHCGSNQVAIDADTSRFSSSANRGLSAAMFTDYTGKVSPQTDTMDRDTFEPANTSSSSGRSGSSYARTCNQSTETNSQSNKRKSRDGEEPECQSKDDELESAGGNKSAQKSGTARRSRAAEVHNLSERRRRDRINEKMKALQDLLPHSTKTDKASMLDEAIEYLKSLQMQLQMMWMGSGMASMMFPGVQHYMSRMGMGMGPPTVPSIHNAMHLARLPLVDPAIPLTQAAPNPAIPLTQAAPNQAAMCQNSMLNQVNYQGHLQNPNFPDQYASYMGFHPLQGASQPINIFGLGSHTAQQSQQLRYPTHSNTPAT